jgi:hypothetical protein
MTEWIRKFTATRTRLAQGAIVDAAGWTGCWPFRRALSYHVGINCDSIVLSEGRLQVWRNGRTIALAILRSGNGFRWSALLHPRHSRPGAAAKSDAVRWEDLLRPRGPGGR